MWQSFSHSFVSLQVTSSSKASIQRSRERHWPSSHLLSSSTYRLSSTIGEFSYTELFSPGMVINKAGLPPSPPGHQIEVKIYPLSLFSPPKESRPPNGCVGHHFVGHLVHLDVGHLFHLNIHYRPPCWFPRRPIVNLHVHHHVGHLVGHLVQCA